jgi:hypothetical protein
MKRKPPRVPLSARPAGCLSDLRIDMLLARDLGTEAEAGARAHLGACAGCTARCREIEAARNAGQAAGIANGGLEAIRAAAALPPARARAAAAHRWWPALAVALGAAAAVAIVIGRARPAGELPSPTRTKGRGSVGFFVKHGEAVRRGETSETVTPGDAVRFTYSSAAPVHVVVIGADSTGKATIYVPAAGGEGGAHPAGRDLELPRSTVLDETLGPETIHAFLCGHAIDAEALRRAVEASPAALPAPVSCTVDRFRLLKVSQGRQP